MICFSSASNLAIVLKQSKSLKINNMLSFAGQTFNLERGGGHGGKGGHTAYNSNYLF